MDASQNTSRQLSDEERADVKNFRGFGVKWAQIAEHFGMNVADLQAQMGEPQWKTPPAELD